MKTQNSNLRKISVLMMTILLLSACAPDLAAVSDDDRAQIAGQLRRPWTERKYDVGFGPSAIPIVMAEKIQSALEIRSFSRDEVSKTELTPGLSKHGSILQLQKSEVELLSDSEISLKSQTYLLASPDSNNDSLTDQAQTGMDVFVQNPDVAASPVTAAHLTETLIYKMKSDSMTWFSENSNWDIRSVQKFNNRSRFVMSESGSLVTAGDRVTEAELSLNTKSLETGYINEYKLKSQGELQVINSQGCRQLIGSFESIKVSGKFLNKHLLTLTESHYEIQEIRSGADAGDALVFERPSCQPEVLNFFSWLVL